MPVASRIHWEPFRSLRIRMGRWELAKENWIPPNWFLLDSLDGYKFGPMAFESALARARHDCDDQAWVDQVIQIGDFEGFKDTFRLSQGTRTPPSDSKDSPIQGLTVSPGNHCSAGCAYCYARPRFTAMPSLETSDATLCKTFEFIRNSPHVNERCAITIGGGGDAAENFSFYLRALALSTAYRESYNLEIPVYLSTIEPSFLTEERIEVISEHQDWITLSVDGDAGTGYHRPRVGATDLVRRFGSRCKWAASGVFTAPSSSRLAHNYRFLVDAGFDAVQMRPARLPTSHPLALSGVHFETAVAQYSLLFETLRDDSQLLSFVDKLTPADYFGRFFFRYLSEYGVVNRCGAGLASVFVTPEGDIAPCPSTAHSAPSLGHVESYSLRLPVINAMHAKPEDCRACEIANVCGGPCGHESLLATGRLGVAQANVCTFQRDICELAIRTIRGLYTEDASALLYSLRSFARRAHDYSPVQEPWM